MSSSSKLKFNVARDSIKASDSGKETISEQAKPTKPKRTTTEEQKRPTSVRQNNKQLFKKTAKKTEKTSPEKKEKLQNFSSQDVATKEASLEKKVEVKKMKSNDQKLKTFSNQDKSITFQDADSDKHCYTDRNSILEFEMLEKECFNQEADRSKLSELKSEAKLDQIQVTQKIELIQNQAVEQQPANLDNFEILNASPAKQKAEMLLESL